MRLANHLTSIKLSKLTIRRRNWNNSLDCTIFQKYYTSILLAKGIAKMKVPNIFSVIWRAPVTATCGYQGNWGIKVFAVSAK